MMEKLFESMGGLPVMLKSMVAQLIATNRHGLACSICSILLKWNYNEENNKNIEGLRQLLVGYFSEISCRFHDMS